VFASSAKSAKGNDAPVRVLQGQATLLARTSHEIAVDTVHDEIVVTNPFAQAIMFFRGNAQGEEKPLRIIQGPQTLLGGDWDTDNIWMDSVNDEVYTAQSNSQSILVFSGRASGDAAPVRVLHGPKTEMRAPRRVTVDPANNLMAVLASEGIMFFDRTANGDVAPKCVIAGPQTGLGWVGAMNNSKVMLYAPAKKIIFGGGNRRVPKGQAEQRAGTFMAVWKYGDCGDVPPLYKMKGGAGRFDLIPETKEILMSGGNVFYMPEAF
jgi:hypothetical protein